MTDASEVAVFPKSIWADSAPVRVQSAPLRGSRECDTVIIGGGLTGLSAALHLARQGQSVVVLEAMAIGWGASGRNNGQVIPTLSGADPDGIRAGYGDVAEQFIRLVGASATRLFDLVREEGIDAQAEQTGWFQPAHSPGRVRLSKMRVEAWSRLGFSVQLLDREQTRELLGSTSWYGGMLNPTGGHVNPLALARGIASAAEKNGAVIHEKTPATSWHREENRWVVATGNGCVRSRNFLLCTNAYTGEVVPGFASRLARTVVPVMAWMTSTPPVADHLRSSILPGRQAVSDTRGDLRFFRYDASNRLITGAAVIGSRNIRERVAAKASCNMADAYPELGPCSMTHVWSGYIGMNADHLPHVHNIGPDGWAWIGCNGRGVALAVSMGMEMAKAVSGHSLSTLALPVSRMRPLPFHAVIRRLAPTYLAWLDRKDKTELKP